MIKFGILKSKILQSLTESYVNGDKKKMKEILSLIKNKDLKELYIFYEQMENKYIEDKESAILFVEEIRPLLKEKIQNINSLSKDINKIIGDIEINESTLYSDLDMIMEDDKLSNIDKKIKSKKNLVEHLTSKKEIKETTKVVFTENESLLHAVLANNFNMIYENTLNESQKRELIEILSMSNEKLTESFNLLKESIDNKVMKLLNEEQNSDVIEKLNQVEDELRKMNVSKYNYYRLIQLDGGIS